MMPDDTTATPSLCYITVPLTVPKDRSCLSLSITSSPLHPTDARLMISPSYSAAVRHTDRDVESNFDTDSAQW